MEDTAPPPIAADLPLRRPEHARLLLREAQVAFSLALFLSFPIKSHPFLLPHQVAAFWQAAGAAVAGVVVAEVAAVVAHHSPHLLRPAARPMPPAPPPSAAALPLHRPPRAQRPLREAQAAFFFLLSSFEYI